MARLYAKLYTSIWGDEDFIILTEGAQRLYLLLFSHPAINNAGIIAYTPGRWANLAPNTKIAAVRRYITELIRHRFIVLDTRTEEAWVRSYMRRDRVLETPQLRRAAIAAIAECQSPIIRTAIQDEYGDPLPDLSNKGSPDPSPDPSTDVLQRQRHTSHSTQQVSQSSLNSSTCHDKPTTDDDQSRIRALAALRKRQKERPDLEIYDTEAWIAEHIHRERIGIVNGVEPDEPAGQPLCGHCENGWILNGDDLERCTCRGGTTEPPTATVAYLYGTPDEESQ